MRKSPCLIRNRSMVYIQKKMKMNFRDEWWGSWLSLLPLWKTGTSGWSGQISHITGSFVGHSPSDMLCPPVLQTLVWKDSNSRVVQTVQTAAKSWTNERNLRVSRSVHTHTQNMAACFSHVPFLWAQPRQVTTSWFRVSQFAWSQRFWNKNYGLSMWRA